MDVFNIIGPIMVGPSSSHTAGAVRIGLLTRAICADEPVEASITLHGSFAATGKGHGTDKALVAGLLGLQPDDERLPHAFELAKERGLSFTFDTAQLGDVHPNTAMLSVKTANGTARTVTGSSIGGGEVRIVEIDGYPVDLQGNLEAIVTRHTDQPGVVALVATLLAARGVNIATMRLSRNGRGAKAMMVVECDGKLPDDIETQIKNLGGMDWVVHVHPVS